MRSPARTNWWLWISGGVAWGLLCVGVRHVTLRAGLDMQKLLAERHPQISRVQVLERQVAKAKQLERLERLAAGYGFIKPKAAQLVIAAPEEGLLAGLFGGSPRTSLSSPVKTAIPAPEEGRFHIRSREEVVVEPRVIEEPAGARGAR